MNMTRPTRLIITVLVLLAAGLLLWTPIKKLLFGTPPVAPSVLVSGNIEAHQSVLSFTEVQAPISWLPFDEGKSVQVGTVLAQVDDRLYRQQLQIDRTIMAVAQKQVAVNESNLAAVRNTVISDRLDLANKERDFVRDQSQLKINAVSQQAFDLTSTVVAQAAATLARDQALVQEARDNIDLARASLASDAAKLALDQVTLSYTVLKAPFSGVLAVREAELGELAGPGVAIFTLDDLDHVWLRAYVNETNLSQVRLGEPVAVSTDTYPDHRYHGRIGFISSEAEFTPKTVETHAERVTLVYRLRIDIDNPTHELLPGMPAEATITLLPAGK
uniref:Putative efflux pump component n=1 Tax=mine drainage metagenome TaxID=410659 RepID=E6QT07_9ZZZZ